MYEYADEIKIKDALQLYFSQYHFKDGGYNDKFFKIKLGSLFIPVPNIKARLDAVKFHDIHHLVTGYTAAYKGEAEIGAWEIASGCGKYWVAWILNMGSFIVGMLLYQRPLLNAFLAGRLVKTNLYKGAIYNDKLLDKSVSELRSEILNQTAGKNSVQDYLMFVWWCLISLVYHVAVVCLIIFVVYKVWNFLF